MRMCVVAALMLLPMLAGCEMPYHPLKGGEGFTEVPVGPDSYQISFIGDADMSITEARRYALVRAAELAALHDRGYFQIQNERIYVSASSRYWPSSDTPYVETRHGRDGREWAVIRHSYEPGYVETYAIPDVEMQVQLTASAAAPSIPAGYLLRQAQADRIKLSPGVAERLAGLPSGAVALPPEPTPTTKPAPVAQPSAPPGS